jgi:hypothetical protein
MFEIASGIHFFKEEYNIKFNNILREYADIILGTYGGHSHFDSFRMVYNNGTPFCFTSNNRLTQCYFKWLLNRPNTVTYFKDI